MNIAHTHLTYLVHMYDIFGTYVCKYIFIGVCKTNLFRLPIGNYHTHLKYVFNMLATQIHWQKAQGIGLGDTHDKAPHVSL